MDEEKLKQAVLDTWCLLYKKGFLGNAINKAKNLKSLSVEEKTELILACNYAQQQIALHPEPLKSEEPKTDQMDSFMHRLFSKEGDKKDD